ncbi:HAMP domain-containing sensor histidine kinase [Sulfuricurvum sp.]|uniref:sensor histidine kinase n=1 Tax=Sulfuricurvum sp. TaxID=2025608 RepID=UPI002621E863|nr:HAMP domain-containing sensor histidine kinase [Sulfuricurvum sp.]MDD3597757.1 HAMP domain-containing sensor histidine kinase [Sulfuricurvum sp.]
MLKAERASLIQFVLLFVILNTLFLLTLSVLYYYYQKNIYYELRQNSMLFYAGKVYDNIYSAESVEEMRRHVIKDPRFEIAFLDKHKRVLFASSTGFDVPVREGIFEFKDHLYQMESIEMKSLHTVRYIAIRADSIEPELARTREAIYIVLIFSTLFMTLMIYTLSKLFLRPLRVYIGKLDRFIRDTTHELNTPLSIISMSLERLREEELAPKALKHTERITVALRTISHLYNDLTFLTLYQKTRSNTQTLDLSMLLKERIDYFRPLADAKKISFELDIHSVTIDADTEKMARIIDNLLSNAIKYNKRSGTISVILKESRLHVSDTGIGIPEDKLHDIFIRYSRFDEANGGFGIGLNIVRMIAAEYGFAIDVDSKIDVGTTFTLNLTPASH